MSSSVDIRAKWCDILENLLECPVCCEIPESYIYQCLSGHHICRNCRYKIAVCPICEKPFSYTRNYLAEALSVSLKDIMISLMCPTHIINGRILENKICVCTQTQEIYKASVEVQTGKMFFTKNKFTQTKKMSISKNAKIQIENKLTMDKNIKQKLLYPRVGRGFYPCHIGSCTVSLSHGKMIEHLKSCHTDMFCIFQANNGIFKREYKLEYIVPKNHDLAFLIQNMGLFFINITILPTGNLTGAVFVVNNAAASKKFMFELTIGTGQKAITYSGTVKTCRISRIQAMKDCLFKKNSELHEILCINGMFNCSLNIKHSNITEINNDFMKRV